MVAASVIFRYSNRSQRRLRNLNTLIKYASRKNDIELIISTMEINNPFIGGAKNIFTNRPFESAQANNIGASHATSNILIFQDADIIFTLHQYNYIIKAITEEGYDAVRVGERCVNLSEPNSMFMSKSVDNMIKILSQTFNDCFRDAPGACVAFSRDAFIRIGGHCELFKVYGWEDCYLLYKMNKLCKVKRLNGQMLHLSHEENYQIGKQPVNSKLYYEILYTDGGNGLKCAERDKADLIKKYPVFAV